MTRLPHVYISHSWSLGDDYDKLREVLAASDHTVRLNGLPVDHPVHATTSDSELRAEMRKHMVHTQMLIVQAGTYERFARWIEEEINLAHYGYQVRRPVLAIVPFDAPPRMGTLLERADRVVMWSHDSILNAVHDLIEAPLEPAVGTVAVEPMPATERLHAHRFMPPTVVPRRSAVRQAPQLSAAALRRSLFGAALPEPAAS